MGHPWHNFGWKKWLGPIKELGRHMKSSLRSIVFSVFQPVTDWNGDIICDLCQRMTTSDLWLSNFTFRSCPRSLTWADPIVWFIVIFIDFLKLLTLWFLAFLSYWDRIRVFFCRVLFRGPINHFQSLSLPLGDFYGGAGIVPFRTAICRKYSTKIQKQRVIRWKIERRWW